MIHRIRRLLAPNPIYRQLYPPPKISIRIRRYEERDREQVIYFHDSNAPNRFPKNHRPVFEEFIDSGIESFFVVETDEKKIAACCGVVAVGPFVNVLCYGLVAPEYQRFGIGSSMTLARLAFATRWTGNNFSFIFAVEKSMGFYKRFGYAEAQKWKHEDGNDHPVGLLSYHSSAISRIERMLKRRGHLIDPSIDIHRDSSREAIIEEIEPGKCRIELKSNNASEAIGTSSADPNASS